MGFIWLQSDAMILHK